MSFSTYISIDVATKSLAIGVYKLRSFSNLTGGMPTGGNIIAINKYCDDTIQILYMNVFDINNGIKLKDTTIIDKAVALKGVLKHFDDSMVFDNSTQVLIEYQMNANHASNAIFNMLIYHYADRYPIHIVKPSIKNTIVLHPKLSHADFLGMASNNYKANKEHTKYSMLFLLTLCDKLHFIENIKKKHLDDIADTLCQCIAWHKRNCH